MIRITQTYLINFTCKELENEGWQVLYKDLPGGRRSGVGIISSINDIWEKIYNLSPDILLSKNNKLLLLEVDTTLNEEYLNKLGKYKLKETLLLKELQTILEGPVNGIEYGFVSKNQCKNLTISQHLLPFTYIYYDKVENRLIKQIISN